MSRQLRRRLHRVPAPDPRAEVVRDAAEIHAKLCDLIDALALMRAGAPVADGPPEYIAALDFLRRAHEALLGVTAPVTPDPGEAA
jgi:hypothetical protein